MIRPFLVGFATTLRHFFKKSITVNYPAQKVPVFPKFRGKQVLMRDEDGLEKCVACGLCSVACPADAIYLEAAENDGSVAAGPRYAKIYQIHKTRCIFCGYCEEACPVAAIFMGKDYELAVYSKQDFIWDKADLLVPAQAAAAPGRLTCQTQMKLGALGDVHGDFASVRTIMARHPEVEWWVTVGDLADDRGAYQAPPALLHWIKGNNDNLEVIAGIGASRHRTPNLRYLPNGVPLKLGSMSVVGLGGTFAPTWYERLPGDLPRPRLGATPPGEFPRLARDDKRRHFLRVEVEACKRLRGIDLFLSHEAARPFLMEVRGRRQDVGKTPINEVLAALRPRMHLSGHHHVYSDDVRQGVRSIGLDPVGQSYLMIETATWRYERLET